MINGEIDRLNRSVSQLLSFSRPAVVAASQERLSEIIASVTGLTRADLEEKYLRLVTSLEADPILEGQQAAALKEVIMNLVLNAVQAVEDGTEIRIESRSPRESDLEVSISDSGPGIPEELEERIFEPFFTTKQRGTGLGLAIVARRVRELGGDIRLESPVASNRGARFVVVFPMAQLVGSFLNNEVRDLSPTPACWR